MTVISHCVLSLTHTKHFCIVLGEPFRQLWAANRPSVALFPVYNDGKQKVSDLRKKVAGAGTGLSCDFGPRPGLSPRPPPLSSVPREKDAPLLGLTALPAGCAPGGVGGALKRTSQKTVCALFSNCFNPHTCMFRSSDSVSEMTEGFVVRRMFKGVI